MSGIRSFAFLALFLFIGGCGEMRDMKTRWAVSNNLQSPIGFEVEGISRARIPAGGNANFDLDVSAPRRETLTGPDYEQVWVMVRYTNLTTGLPSRTEQCPAAARAVTSVEIASDGWIRCQSSN